MTKAEVLRAFREVTSEEFAHIPDENGIEHEFSGRFNRKMEKLLKKVEYNSTHAFSKNKRKILALIAAIIMLLGGLMGVSALIEPAGEIVVESYDGYDEVRYNGSRSDRIIHEYSLTKVPEGFVETQRTTQENLISVEYENPENGHILDFRQQTTDCDTLSIDNEHGTTTVHDVDGVKVYVYANEHGNSFFAFWICETYMMSLTYSGGTSVDALLEMVKWVA